MFWFVCWFVNSRFWFVYWRMRLGFVNRRVGERLVGWRRMRGMFVHWMVGCWVRVWCKDVRRVVRHWCRVMRYWVRSVRSVRRMRAVRSRSGMVRVSLIFNISVVAIVIGIVGHNLSR